MMAFIDFSDAAPVAPDATLALPTTQAVTLSALERRIVALARDEGLESLRPARKRSWLARVVLGPVPPSKMLANEQLEALRRLAVLAWHHGYTVPVSALREAKAAGHSEAKVGAVVDLVGRTREPFRRVAA